MRKIIFTGLILGMTFLSFGVSKVYGDCPVDPYEPNDTPADAYMLSYGDTVAGAWICPIEDYDYYKFQIIEGEYVRVFEIFPTTLRPVIYILNQNQTPIFNNLYTNDMKFFASYTGTAYIVVTKRYWNNNPFEYSFGLQKLDVAPDVLSVEDVPNDQGLQVTVKWKPSFFDPQTGTNQTSSYSLWREVQTDVTSIITGSFRSFEEISFDGMAPVRGSIFEIDGSNWTFIAQIPAVSNRPFVNYSYVAPTLEDNVPTTFVVSAIPMPGFSLPVLWGEPGTGISIDNMPPEFTSYAIQSHSNAIAIEWEVDLTIHYDLEGFNVYRHNAPGFTPNEQNKIASLDSSAVQYLDESVTAGMNFYYVIESFDNSSNSGFTSELSSSITNITTTGSDVTPTEFKLSQNFPNPFNPVTRISFDIAVNSNVELKVYNELGQLVNVLVNDVMSPGSYNVTFDASSLPSGVYFYSLKAGEFRDTKRLVLIK